VRKLYFLLLAILLVLPDLSAASQPGNPSRIGHIGHFLYYAISAPMEAKVGAQVKIVVEVWSTSDIVLMNYRLKVFGAGTNYDERVTNMTDLPQGAGIPKTVSVNPSREDMIYLELRAEYDYVVGGQHQQGYGDMTIPITYARDVTYDELKEQNQQLSNEYYNYTQLEGQYLDAVRSLQDVEARLANQTTGYDALRLAYEQLQSENQAMQANYDDALNELELQRGRATTYEYSTLSLAVAMVVLLLAVVVTRRGSGKRSQAEKLKLERSE
jgi:hypothetical protein